MNNYLVNINNEIKEALIKQLYSPVRWTETIQFLVSKGIDTAIEAGPGKVLQGLVKRIDKSITCISVNDNDSLSKAKELIK